MTTALFHADAHWSRGMGHLYRCMALAADLQKKIQATPLFFGQLSEAACRILQGNAFRFQAVSEEKHRYPALQELLRRETPSMVINDVLDADPEILAMERAAGAKIICLDDTRAAVLHADAVINPIFFTQYKPEKIAGSCRYYAGPSYMVLDQRFSEAAQSADAWDEQGRRILVTMGGTDNWGTTRKVVRALLPMAIQDGLKIGVVVGPGFQDRDELVGWINDFPGGAVTVFPDVPWLGSLILQNGLVVCAGGITLYECAALGRPMFAVANEPHEADTIAYFADQGVGIQVGSRHEWPDKALPELIRGKVAEGALNKMREHGRKLVDGLGCLRVVDIVSSIIPK